MNYTRQIVETITCNLELPGARVLEIGCGTAGNSVALAELGAEVYGVDLSRSALEHSRSTSDSKRQVLMLIQADAKHLPFADESFDVIFHQGFLEHFHHPDSFIMEQHRVLRDGGYLLVDVPQKYNLYTLYKHFLISIEKWNCGTWETQFSFNDLSLMLINHGFHPTSFYGRDVFPYWISLRHQLIKLGDILGRRHIDPIIQSYDRMWSAYETSKLGRNSLMCLGILAKKALRT